MGIHSETEVMQLGLKKVAYTIAQNVKLRKGQKDGMKKFSFTMGEWEYDLNKLKQTYYRNDFSCPLTRKINGLSKGMWKQNLIQTKPHFQKNKTLKQSQMLCQCLRVFSCFAGNGR
jgi:hypothetical protein